MKTLINILLAFFSFGAFAQDAILYSRNMPKTCEYVYTVESDLRIELPINALDQEVYYQLQNSWNPSQWTPEKKLTLSASANRLVGELTFVSMSLPGNYLYRIISISFPNSNIKCVGEFGREFGEACKHGGREETPWRARKIICQ